MKEFNPEKEYKALTKSKISEKKVIVATCLITALTVIGYSFANYTAHPADILAVDTKVGEFSKGTFGNQFMEGIQGDDGSDIVTDDHNNLRYTTQDPDNYVTFNGEEAGWRIIGEFANMWECPDNTEVTVDTYTEKCTETKLLKLIRKDFLENIAWASTNVNDWSQASLMTLLNSGDYWTGSGTYSSNGLTEDAKKMIATTMWNLGGTSNYSTSTAEMFYTAERGTTVYSGRPTKWIGKVGLMYPSDYGFATGGGTTGRDTCLQKEMYNWDTVSECYKDDWLFNSAYQWTLSPRSDLSSSAFDVHARGRVGYSNGVGSAFGVRPVVYLKSSVQITGGHGKSDDPYILSVTN